LVATITELTARIEAFATNTEDLAVAVTSNFADLKADTAIQEKEYADFVKGEKELMEDIAALKNGQSQSRKRKRKRLLHHLFRCTTTECRTFCSLYVWWQMLQPSP